MDYVACSSAKESWQEGWGKYLRLRWLAPFASFDLILSVLGFIKLELPYAIMITVVAVVLLSAVFSLRLIRIRISEVNSVFHDVTHTIRDKAVMVLEATAGGGYKYAFSGFNNDAAERIALFFRKVLNNQDITCAVRLAIIADGKEQYATVGRSTGLDPSRANNSEPIPYDEGVADYLRKAKKLGVLIIKDIKKAIEKKIWYPTKNDSLPDIRSVMVAPINGYVDPNPTDGYVELKKNMVGLLYIGAKRDIFSPFHVDLVRGYADLLGIIYPLIIGKIKERGSR